MRGKMSCTFCGGHVSVVQVSGHQYICRRAGLHCDQECGGEAGEGPPRPRPVRLLPAAVREGPLRRGEGKQKTGQQEKCGEYF